MVDLSYYYQHFAKPLGNKSVHVFCGLQKYDWITAQSIFRHTAMCTVFLAIKEHIIQIVHKLNILLMSCLLFKIRNKISSSTLHLC